MDFRRRAKDPGLAEVNAAGIWDVNPMSEPKVRPFDDARARCLLKLALTRWRNVSTLSMVIVSLAVLGRAFPQTNEETQGQVAEQAGKLREAVTHYVAALQSTNEGSADDQRLKEKIIKLVQKLDPLPAVPEEALRYIGRGKAAVETATVADDFRRAAAEFQKAVRLAPWLSSGYFNLGMVQEKAGLYAEAIRNFRLYLLAAPSASDAQEVQTRIFGLEYKIERRREEERAAQERVKREQQEQEARTHDFSRLEGEWCRESSRIVGVLSTPRCGFRMRITRAAFEIFDEYQTEYKGVFEGRKITAQHFLTSECPEMGTSVTGVLSDDERRIEFRGVMAKAYYRPNGPNPTMRCTVLETTPFVATFVRR